MVVKRTGPVLSLGVIAGAVLAVACSPSQGTLTGEVFVVTNGRVNIKLGLVSVRVLSERAVQSLLDRVKSDTRQGVSAIAPKLVAAKANVAKVERDMDPVLDNADQHIRSDASRIGNARFLLELGKLLDSKAGRALPKAERTASLVDAARTMNYVSSEKGPYDTDFDVAIRKAMPAAAAIDAALIQQRQLEAQIAHFDTSEFLFGVLPSADIASAKTNSDGQFAVTIPTRGRFAVAAHAERDVLGGSPEEYYWLVWVSLNGKSAVHVMLSNDNLTTAKSDQSVVSSKN